MKIKLLEITEQSIKDVDLKELLNIHRHVHGLWAGLKNLTPEMAKEQEALLLKVHKILIAEMVARKIKHSTPLAKSDEDQTLYGWDYFETFRNLYPWQIEDAGSIIRVLQKYYCKTVLDVGCGVGWLMALLKGWFEPTGLEPSQAATEFGHRQNFNIYQGYGEAMPFVDSLFDGVITNHVLEHVEDPVKLINECARVSKRVSIHVVPLGTREDPTHIHEFHTLDELRELGEDIPFPTRFSKSVYNNAIVIVSKTIRPIGIFKDYSDIVLIPKYVSEVGSSVKQEDHPSDDIDLVVRKLEPDRQLEIEMRNRMKKGYFEKTHWIYQPEGPTGPALGLYDLVLRSNEVMVAKEDAAAKARTPLWRFTPPKPSRAFYLYDDKDILEVWEKWCEERKVVNVELKYNGFRAIVEGDKNGKILIFFEGNQKDRSKQFPLMVEQLQQIKKPFIFDCDFGAIGTDGSRLSRIDLQYLVNEANIVDEKFTTKKGVEGKLKVTVFDVLFFSESVTHLPQSERRKILDSISFSGLKLFAKSKATTARSLKSFVSAVKKYSREGRSEGVVIKDLTGQYVGFGGNNIYWCKAKNVSHIKTRVSDKQSTKTSGVYTYHHECRLGDDWLPLGKTMNSKIMLTVGDVMTVQVEEIIPEVKDDVLHVSLVIPVVLGKASGSANTVKGIIAEGRRAGTLQTNPELDKLLGKSLRVAKSQDDGTQKQSNEFSKKETNIDLEEGWQGTGIIQLHIMGMTEEESENYVKTRKLEGANPAHLDFRLLPTDPKKSFWEGWELFDPASTAKPIKIYDSGFNKIMGSFKGESESGGHGDKVDKNILHATSMQWLKYGLIKPKVFLPGEAGTGRIGTGPGAVDHYAVMDGLATFKFSCGVQDEHFKEFWFEISKSSKEYEKLKHLNGRNIITFAPLGDKRVWLFSHPADQEMKSELEMFTNGK